MTEGRTPEIFSTDYRNDLNNIEHVLKNKVDILNKNMNGILSSSCVAADKISNSPKSKALQCFT